MPSFRGSLSKTTLPLSGGHSRASLLFSLLPVRVLTTHPSSPQPGKSCSSHSPAARGRESNCFDHMANECELSRLPFLPLLSLPSSQSSTMAALASSSSLQPFPDLDSCHFLSLVTLYTILCSSSCASYFLLLGGFLLLWLACFTSSLTTVKGPRIIWPHSSWRPSFWDNDQQQVLTNNPVGEQRNDVEETQVKGRKPQRRGELGSQSDLQWERALLSSCARRHLRPGAQRGQQGLSTDRNLFGNWKGKKKKCWGLGM